MNLEKIQQELRNQRLDGWLFFDHHVRDPLAYRVLGFTAPRIPTRRWYYFIPASGRPKKLVHAIEPFHLDHLHGDKITYAGRVQLEQGVIEMTRGAKIIAMEYSPECAIPYLSRVDAGTVDFLRRIGLRIVSSGDLVGRFEAAWDADEIATHRAASEKLYRIKDRTFELVGAKLAAGETPNEYEIQQQMQAWFAEEGMVNDAAPIVAAQENAGNPHYAPTREKSRVIRPNELLLLDLWGKLNQPGAVYADITWTGFAGEPPQEIVNAFAAIVAGRLLGLNAEQLTQALGIAGSMGGGLLAFAKAGNGAMVKRLHMGRAAEAGVVAALLARDGYEGPDSVLEGKYGYLEAYARDGDASQFTKALGRVLGRPTIFPMPAFVARVIFGEKADGILLSSARVFPHRLQATSYPFRHPELEPALRHVV